MEDPSRLGEPRRKKDFIMRTVSLEELLEAGCHFGHQVSRQNPKARDFIFEARDNIHIIDLEKTKEGLEEGAKFVQALAKRGGTLLVLATKRQALGILNEELKRAEDSSSGTGLFFVDKRWIGGTLTNFAEVAKNYKKLKDLSYRLQDENEKAGFTKKEVGEWEKNRLKLESFYGGIAEMTKKPDALFIIDTHLEHVAVIEALKSGVPTVGITDTNADPTIIDYPIPANDDAVGSLKLIINYIFDAWIEGRKAFEKGKKEEEEKKAKDLPAGRQGESQKPPSSEVINPDAHTGRGPIRNTSEVKESKAEAPKQKETVAKKKPTAKKAKKQ